MCAGVGATDARRHGAKHASDLITRDMLELSDAVLVDDSGYYLLCGKVRLAKARVVGVRRASSPKQTATPLRLVSAMRPIASRDTGKLL